MFIFSFILSRTWSHRMILLIFSMCLTISVKPVYEMPMLDKSKVCVKGDCQVNNKYMEMSMRT